MKAILLLAALSTIPQPCGVVEDTVDVCEWNSFFDENGRLVFDQQIGWDFTDEGYRVRFWRLIRNGEPIPHRGKMVWLDGERLRRVRCRSVRRSWTQVDPELEDRANLPQEERRELGR